MSAGTRLEGVLYNPSYIMSTMNSSSLSTSVLPSYPQFCELKLEHKTLIDDFNAQFPPYSDFNFTSLFCWSTDGSTEISLLQGNLVIRQPDYQTGEPVASILGSQQIDESLVTLCETMPSLKLIPEHTVMAIKNPGQFDITEDRDNHDYVYDLVEITELAGKKFKKLRNKINAFTSSTAATLDINNVSELNDSEKKEFIDLFDEWAKTAKQSKEDSAIERVAIGRLLENSASLGLIFTTIRQANRLVAFSICEVLDNKYALCHFEKALAIHDGMFLFVAHEAGKTLLAQGSKHVNWEQDLGITGMREAKTKWQPQSFLKKYTISVRVNEKPS